MADFNLIHTLSVIEIGTMVSTFLFGITTVQTYIYFSRFPDDRWQLKALVTTVALLELGHAIAVLHAFYTISILQYGQREKIFAKAPVGIAVATFLSGYIACLVQAFFTDRARRFSRRTYLAILSWFLSFLRFVATTGITVLMIRRSLTDFDDNWRWLVTVCLVIGAVVDIIIAVVLCYDLAKERKASFTRTTKLVDRVLLMTIQTGLATSVVTLAVTICFLTVTESFTWVAIYVCLARVFSNSLLATLNARANLRRMNDNSYSLRFAQAADHHRDKAPVFSIPKLSSAGGIVTETSAVSSTTFRVEGDECISPDSEMGIEETHV